MKSWAAAVVRQFRGQPSPVGFGHMGQEQSHGVKGQEQIAKKCDSHSREE